MSTHQPSREASLQNETSENEILVPSFQQNPKTIFKILDFVKINGNFQKMKISGGAGNSWKFSGCQQQSRNNHTKQNPKSTKICNKYKIINYFWQCKINFWFQARRSLATAVNAGNFNAGRHPKFKKYLLITTYLCS